MKSDHYCYGGIHTCLLKNLLSKTVFVLHFDLLPLIFRNLMMFPYLKKKVEVNEGAMKEKGQEKRGKRKKK